MSGGGLCGVFNYAEDADGVYGTLQDEHFQALERFWFDVVEMATLFMVGLEWRLFLFCPKTMAGVCVIPKTTFGAYGMSMVLLSKFGLKYKIGLVNMVQN
jgi:hypothetical protein